MWEKEIEVRSTEAGVQVPALTYVLSGLARLPSLPHKSVKARCNLSEVGIPEGGAVWPQVHTGVSRCSGSCGKALGSSENREL